MSTLQERLADQLAALVEAHDSQAALHLAEHLVRSFVTRESGVDEDLVTRIDHGFASAAADRQRIERETAADRERLEHEAAADRAQIRSEMREGFAAAAEDRQAIRDEMREGFAAAAASREELRVSLMDAIERSATTTKEDLRQEIARLADGMAMFQDAVNRRLGQMTWVTGLLFGSITILLALRGW